ncbi:MAG: hypothetical protein QOC88_2669 [Mycobacterium sp.]|nr:hypothetical protein [Mycobacterium sp.]MDT5165775.1 hypothetical protein [Mycobacterium sp.]MDT5206400.1 hypothetical protein [Mycobacterium sp.]MDT5227070.1 hypothetical protein [Mycobacterium sp.]MDT7736105.1 hypothetical protein [Mycobacterium sp.]
MKYATTIMKTAIGAAGIAAVSFATAGSASAAPNIQGFGTSEPLIDGPMITNYTVSNLEPSTISIPGYTPKGTLYQADVTVRSDGGVVTPQVRDFSARGPNGQTYKLIDKVEVPNGLNPAPIPQGSESKGTLYFDATGAPPNGIVYNDGLQDILMWTSNVPGTSMQSGPGTSTQGGPGTSTPGQQGVTGSGEPSDSGPAPGALPAPATT